MNARGWLTGLVLGCSFTSGVLIAAERQALRKAWEWTVEERIAARRDRTNREQAARTDGLSARFVIDGRSDPELFLPYELMGCLLEIEIPDAAATARARAYHEITIRQMGWEPVAFWRDLEIAGAEFDDISRSAAGDPTAEQSRMMCGARIDALAAMRSKYKRFDEFLYRSVASNRAMVADFAPEESLVRWLARGCR